MSEMMRLMNRLFAQLRRVSPILCAALCGLKRVNDGLM